MKAALLMTLVFAVTFQVFGQGPLMPPGAPGASMKSLDQLESRVAITNLPFVITESGSYYLTASLTGGAGANGITVEADDVTIDLNGFTLKGTASTHHGIYQDAAYNGLTVRNGKVQRWSNSGGDLYGEYGGIFALGSGNLIEAVQATGNNNVGIRCGEDARIVNCTARASNQRGFVALPNSVLVGCVAQQSGIGFIVQDGGVVRDCAARNNNDGGFSLGASCSMQACTATGNGADGIEAAGGLLVDCVANNNTNRGFYLTASGGKIRGGTANGNGGNGMDAVNGCSFMDCSAQDNAGHGLSAGHNTVVDKFTGVGNGLDSPGNDYHGIYAGANARLSGCLVQGNDGHGVLLMENGSVRDCTATENTLDGLSLGNGGVVQECVARGNGEHGIAVSSLSQVLKNTCNGNASNGIHVTSGANVIEDNNLNDNAGVGIWVDGGANRIARNLAQNNLAGIYLTPSSGSNQIEKNNVLGSATGLLIEGGNNVIAGNMVKGNTDNYNLALENQVSILLCQVPESIDWPCTVELAGTLRCVGGLAGGISIASDNVTVDMKGYGILASQESGSDIAIEVGDTGVGAVQNIAIRNGFIQGSVTNDGNGNYSGRGFWAGIAYPMGSVPGNVHVSDVSVQGCWRGISLGTMGSQVDHCMVSSCSLLGIAAETITDCMANPCWGSAISGQTVINCRGDSYAGTGVYASQIAQNSSGRSVEGTGLDAHQAQNCMGTTWANSCDGFVARAVAIGCSGSYFGTGTGSGLAAHVANSCLGNSYEIVYRYNMP